MLPLNPLIWGATGWAVFFISCFFAGAGMMYTAFFLTQYFKEWRERREASFGDVTYYVAM
jgi:amino acid permease